MTGYVFLLAYPPGYWQHADAALQEETYAAHRAFHTFVDTHGRQVASAALGEGDVATTVRRRGGEVEVTDGPFAETAEIIGGYYEVELPDLDTAIAGAALLPAQYAIDIRPVLDVG